ncbi:MAG: 4-hydroxy-tetrahydrodipicolinate synthase [Candidatus Curtissbacteria bacterium]
MIEKGPQSHQFGRLLTAMVTPLDARGDLSIDRTKRLAEHLIETGTESIVVAGTTGESPTLTERDRMLLLNAVMEAVSGRIPVIAGTSTYSTAESVHLSQLAANEGAAGLLLVTPYYNKPSQEGLFRHFGAISESVPDSPLIVYNVPSRTNVNMQAETVLRLDREFGNVVGLKEAVGITTDSGKNQVALVIEGKSEGFEVWSGNDQDTLEIMKMGGYGVVSVASHLAGDLIKRMIDHQIVGEQEEAQILNDRLMPLFEALFPPTAPEPSPASVKAMLNIIRIPVGDLRLPLVGIPREYHER